jgi:hypothetical protein
MRPIRRRTAYRKRTKNGEVLDPIFSIREFIPESVFMETIGIDPETYLFDLREVR